MRTQQEIEEMKNMIDKKIAYQKEQLLHAQNVAQYDIARLEVNKLMAQYNILLEVLK